MKTIAMKKLLAGSGLLVALALFLTVNILSNVLFKSVRADLTDGNIYTLSQGSKNIVQSLPEPITLRFYVSEKLATTLTGISNYTVRVKELLEEYQREAQGKIVLQILDPEPFSEEEDRAVGYGLQGVAVDTANTTFYFGLVGNNAIDDEETITFFQPNREEFLEYDITQLIYRLAYPKKRVVGIMSALPIQGDPASFMQQSETQQPWMIVSQINELFDVQTLATDSEQIPADIDVLMLVHPKGLTERTLYAIDQYVLKGGHTLVFVDPYSEADQPTSDPKNPFAAMQAPRNSELDKLLTAWGLELVSGKVVGDMKTAKKVRANKDGRSVVIDYPVWLTLNEDNMNSEDIITAHLEAIGVASAGRLIAKENTGFTVTPLLHSGDSAMQVDTSKLGMLADPVALAQDFKAEGQDFIIAARVTGKFKTAFPDGKPKAEKADDKDKESKEDDKTPALKEAKENASVIVIADTDMLEDQFWVQVQNFLGQRVAIPNAANASFVVNALDNLSGSSDLISVRNRGNADRPFTKVAEIKRAAEQKFRAKEKELQARLTQTEQKINELQNQKQDSGLLKLSLEQQQAISGFRAEQLKIRKELRQVQHELQKDIEGLEGTMKFINIGLMPLLISFGGIFLGIYSSGRRRQT